MKTRLSSLLSLLVFLASPAAFAEVFLEDFADPLGDWTGGWFYQNSNAENYYTTAGSCDPNNRGNNPTGLWLSDDRGCGVGFTPPPVQINILNGFGDAATQFSLDACNFTSEVTMNVYDKDGVLDQSTAIPGGCTFPFSYSNYNFVLGNGISQFEFVGSNIEGNFTIDNVVIDTDPIVQTNPRATFYVSKDFTDDNPMGVEVTLECNGGLPLKQTFTISDSGTPAIGQVYTENTEAGAGNPPSVFSSVTFTVTDFIEGQLDCEVTEAEIDNYSAEYDNGATTSTTSCAYTDLSSGANSCLITNTPGPGSFTVSTVWELTGPDVEPIDGIEVEIVCDEDNGGIFDQVEGVWVVTEYMDDGDSVTVSVDTSGGAAECWAEPQAIPDSGVETSNGCGPTNVASGSEEACEITFSLFFEGIPTMNQWGMALMALLMLGIGFVGVRRFA